MGTKRKETEAKAAKKKSKAKKAAKPPTPPPAVSSSDDDSTDDSSEVRKRIYPIGSRGSIPRASTVAWLASHAWCPDIALTTLPEHCRDRRRSPL